MKFRGLDPRTRFIRWGLFGIAVGLVLGATVPSAIHALATTWESNRSTLPWIVERMAGFLAYFALAGSVIYGLLLSTKILDAIAHRPVTFNLHQDLAGIGLALAAVHGMLMSLDRTMPFSLTQILVPGLAPYAPLGVAAGQIALYLTAIVMASFYVRRTIGQRTWRILHYLSFFAFLGATAHGVAAGSDSGSAWAWGIYVTATVAVVFLLTYRIALSVATRRARGAGSTLAPARG